MVESVNVIGRGRVGSAVAARLEERGIPLVEHDAELTLLCVPDTAIRDVARGQSQGQSPWIAHVSGATPLSALDPHTRRFSLHPLQTFTRARGPEQLDGAWAAVTAAHAPSSCSGPRARVNVCSGWSENRRVCGSRAESGVAPLT